jgi:hypothetical protein
MFITLMLHNHVDLHVINWKVLGRYAGENDKITKAISAWHI